MKRGVLAAALALGLAACSPPAPSADPADQTDTAWTLSAEGYGPVRIGMTIEAASTALGAELHAGGAMEPEVCETYAPAPEAGHDGVRIMTQGGLVTQISDHGTDPAIRTPEGVGVGSTSAEVRAAYPDAFEEPAKYDPPPAHSLTVWTVPNERGLRFHVNAEGIVTTVVAGDDSILLVEGCS